MTPERFHRLKQCLLRRQHDMTILADDVHKEHNVSAIIRTCDAVGIAKAHAVTSNPEFRRHHMVAGGSRRWVELELHESTAAAYIPLREAGMQVLTAHAGPGARDYRDVDYTQPTAIVVGAELEGPTRYALDHADGSIAIPMHGLVESLNVSVAAAVILFEAERQRKQADLYAREPPDQQAFDKTLFEWAWPDIARRCQSRGRPYPPLDEDGQMLVNPLEPL